MINKKEDTKGITSEKDEFSDWFSQLMIKSDLADYSSVSGCIILKPFSYAIWEKVVGEIDNGFKKLGIRNVYFPLLIPEKVLAKEKEHVEGFSPEVAWVTHAGNTKLAERLAVRPTSETIMYESYSKWIRSWRDLPLKLNQWNNVVRWEFKHPIPFLRTREFLWQEGHTAYATEKEAKAEENQIIGVYKKVCEEFMALPFLRGRKTEKEKFAGAEYTVSLEFFMPNGRAIQGPDFHHDGQKFSKAYNIKFLSKDGKEDYVWQNTFGFSTRMLGVMFAIHSDKKGLVLPPRVALNKVVIVPILFEKTRNKVLSKAKELEKKLKRFSPILDDREEYNPGFKFNEWELKGIPLRIEIGPKDIEKKQVVLVQRDTGKKEMIKLNNLDKKVEKILEDMQNRLFEKAKKLLYDNIVEASDLESVKSVVKNKIALVPLCSSRECEDMLKFKTGGAKVLNIPDSQPKKKGKCVVCKGAVDYWGYVGKSY